MAHGRCVDSILIPRNSKSEWNKYDVDALDALEMPRLGIELRFGWGLSYLSPKLPADFSRCRFRRAGLCPRRAQSYDQACPHQEVLHRLSPLHHSSRATLHVGEKIRKRVPGSSRMAVNPSVAQVRSERRSSPAGQRKYGTAHEQNRKAYSPRNFHSTPFVRADTNHRHGGIKFSRQGPGNV
jgi:hypothetical protein